ncbi:MAG TPA: FKBP-type peptidyl-prolyl cis-trans isomerase [Patescibacteria group bacterium]|nr:FKBP-type peptidyl-prolyl cis-trans isomerase [Patescibacteria group bacterium]
MRLPLLAGLAFVLCISHAQAQTSTSSSKKNKASANTETKTNSKNNSKSNKKSTTATTTETPVTTQKDKNSYAIGVNLGQNFKQQALEIDPAMFERGLRDAMEGNTMAMTDEEIKSAMQALQQQAMARQQENMKKQQEENAKIAEGAKQRGAAFMAQNAKQQGVVTLPSGVQYKILTEGTGPKPSASSTVTTHYRGSLLNGKVFDSSYDRGQPAQFPVNGVIPGWTEVLQLMPVGSKWQVWIPSDKAYGDQGAGQDIGPGEALVFDIELIAVQ